MKLKFVSALIQIASLRFIKALEESKITISSVIYTGPAEKKRVATEKAVGKYARAAFAKRNKVSDREGGESQRK